MKSLGSQHIVEFINCQPGLLNNMDSLEQVVRQALNKAGLSVVKLYSHQFEPTGITLVAIISESHFAIHTYPEANMASLDLYTCTDGSKHAIFFEALKATLQPQDIRQAEINRGNPVGFKNENWISSGTEFGFETRYYIDEVLLSKKSAFQQIDIIQNKNFGKMLFLDKELQLADSDISVFNEQMIKNLSLSDIVGKKVLILGGGDGSLLKSLLQLNPEAVDLVDIDATVIELSQLYFPELCGDSFDDERVHIHHQEVNEFLNGKKYDFVAYDLSLHPEKFTHKSRLEYLDQLFSQIADSLSEKGVIVFQLGSAFDQASLKMIAPILKQYFRDVNYHQEYIPSYCQQWVFASANKT